MSPVYPDVSCHGGDQAVVVVVAQCKDPVGAVVGLAVVMGQGESKPQT
ncbi:hypothetical protein [Klebsiella pneumoniae]|nr:hypothetical protein [Klebsiella pneumoniae]MCR1017512.1 hypothetical protein [Klebsiella pneumoniae]HDS5722089.1 hypothetical protein [Klebsiella pneumoniae subsp. pneumoniae]